jgi:hypothetical protein
MMSEAKESAENTAETDNVEVTDAPEIAISDAPAPKVVPKYLTGRIRPEWKDAHRFRS